MVPDMHCPCRNCAQMVKPKQLEPASEEFELNVASKDISLQFSVPEFFKDEPTLWFLQLESTFGTRKLT